MARSAPSSRNALAQPQAIECSLAIPTTSTFRPCSTGPSMRAVMANCLRLSGARRRRAQHRDGPAGPTVADHARLGVGPWMPCRHRPDKLRLRPSDVLEGLSADGLRMEADEVARMTRLHGDPDLACRGSGRPSRTSADSNFSTGACRRRRVRGRVERDRPDRPPPEWIEGPDACGCRRPFRARLRLLHRHPRLMMRILAISPVAFKG